MAHSLLTLSDNELVMQHYYDPCIKAIDTRYHGII